MKAASAYLVLLASCVILGAWASRPRRAGARMSTPPVDPEVVAMLRESLASREPDVRASALEWIARDPRARDDALIPGIFATLKDSDSSVRSQALANMGWIFERQRKDREGAEALGVVTNALKQTSNRGARLVAVDLLRGSESTGEYDQQRGARQEGRLVANPDIRTLAASLLADPQSSLRPELLAAVAASRILQADPAIVAAVGKALHDDSLAVRSDAADLLITVTQKGEPAIRQQARELLLAALNENDPNVQLRVSRALGILVPPPKAKAPVLSLTGQKLSTSDLPFDFNYFTAFVQPLLAKKYGSASCVDCHTPEANASGSFRILAPGACGRYNLERSQVNFVSVLSVVDRNDPEKSKILLKPLNPRASEGNLRGQTHDGGVFWDNQYDADFEVVEGWLKGAKLDIPPEKQLDFAYFVQHVQPIFSTPGPDGFACVNCHSTHAILHLESPETAEGKFSVAQLENNYQSAHRAIDEAAPTNSFIVRKPTSLREGEPGGVSHAGGVRWLEKKESWQYKTLITWIGMRNLASR